MKKIVFVLSLASAGALFSQQQEAVKPQSDAVQKKKIH